MFGRAPSTRPAWGLSCAVDPALVKQLEREKTMRVLFALGLAAAVCASLAVPMVASAQTPAPQAGQPQAQRPAPPPYRLGVEDMMTAQIQPRHIRIALGAQLKNWPYAAFEAKELRETFDRMARLHPTIGGKPTEPMMSVIKQPLQDLEKAAQAADSKAFTAAYKRVTDGCNACHKINEVDAMVIIVPKNVNPNMWPDQDFRPKKAQSVANR